MKQQNCLTTMKTQTIDNQHGDAILGNRASYRKERVQGHFLWDPRPMNVIISGQKMILLLKLACKTLIVGQKGLLRDQ